MLDKHPIFIILRAYKTLTLNKDETRMTNREQLIASVATKCESTEEAEIIRTIARVCSGDRELSVYWADTSLDAKRTESLLSSTRIRIREINKWTI